MAKDKLRKNIVVGDNKQTKTKKKKQNKRKKKANKHYVRKNGVEHCRINKDCFDERRCSYIELAWFGV